MEDLLNGFLTNIEEQLQEIRINKQMGDGMVTTCNIIFTYLMRRCDETARLYVRKEMSYIEYEVTYKMRDEIFTIMDKIVDICNQEVKKNEADKDSKI